MEKVKFYFKEYLSGILAGMLISIGGLLNLVLISRNQATVGNMFFTVGLFSICFFQFALFTGRAGYLVENKFKNIISLIFVYLGNMTGVIVFGLLFTLLPFYSNLTNVISDVIASKISYDTNLLVVLAKGFFSSLFCGVLVYLAVESFKRFENVFLKVVAIFAFIAAFAIIGFEHCIADMFYFAIGNSLLNYKIYLLTIVVTFGNVIGSIMVNIALKLIKK
ncbi:MAG: formate/nitrite transporter family protein [Bacilli bacterium]